MMLRRSFLIPAAVLFAACGGESLTSPASIGSLLDPDGAVVSADEPAVTASVVGAAHRDAGDKPVVLNFSAVQRADGTVSGSYYYQSVVNHVSIHVDVTCLTVVDNRAWVGGVISRSSIPALVGTVSYFYATDNGEGVEATDEVSLVRAADQPGENLRFCEELPTLLPNREVLRGNVNVTG